MLLSDALKALPDDQFIMVGSNNGWLWFGTVSQAQLEIPELSQRWWEHYLLAKADAQRVCSLNRSTTNIHRYKHYTNIVYRWKDFEAREVKDQWLVDDIPALGIKGGVGIRVSGSEAGIYWTYAEWFADQNKERIREKQYEVGSRSRKRRSKAEQ